MRYMTTFKCRGIDSLQRDTATRDKLVFEGGTTSNLIRVIHQRVYKAIDIFLIEFAPA